MSGISEYQCVKCSQRIVRGKDPYRRNPNGKGFIHHFCPPADTPVISEPKGKPFMFFQREEGYIRLLEDLVVSLLKERREGGV